MAKRSGLDRIRILNAAWRVMDTTNYLELFKTGQYFRILNRRRAKLIEKENLFTIVKSTCHSLITQKNYN
jgi:hypothetical protein